ncbi:glycine betaine uptake BCCT transporter [Candidatus Nitronereus thalassa]|uniref:BCCT family transporter n=1 Tax=Candidatus Nitronereus thalassa TaxID=3020898 RepID=A0ABU3K8K3_9BACT|nr:BCCT family transporter [Candidatus Nitronereus thalassa]MDT7042725.1 BCCT family transporter [Candidatus Nitronereus thalassa]
MKNSRPVLFVSLALTSVFLIWGAFAPKQLAKVSGSIQIWLLDAFGWFYLLCAAGFLTTVILLIFSKYGDIPLGRDGEKPEFPLLTWFAMLFCAGMGIGLVFWGAAEPISHFYDPPFGSPGTPESARVAMQYSFFHWGLHPWAIYTLVGMCLAYFQFRKQEPGLISASCKPILGGSTDGPAGYAIDIIAVFATVFGVATSLGFGAIQISGGLSYLFGVPNTINTQLGIIGLVTVLYMLSAQTGLQRGIKYLSNLNMILALSLMVFLLFLGPTKFIMEIFTSALGEYLHKLPKMSLNLAPFDNSGWVQNWTLFYWAWWIAWAPFVGTFIARISRGRTVREFILGVLFVPSLFCAFWFSIFGGTAISLELFQQTGLNQVIEAQGKEVVLFTLLEHFPLGGLMSLIAIFLISTFFITSADSATFVLGTLTTKGNLNPPNSVKLTWGVVQSVVAAVLLWSGGLKGLQTGSILAAFPFAFIMLLLLGSLLKAFKIESKTNG